LQPSHSFPLLLLLMCVVFAFVLEASKVYQQLPAQIAARNGHLARNKPSYVHLARNTAVHVHFAGNKYLHIHLAGSFDGNMRNLEC
jgi:hypothetical protein